MSSGLALKSTTNLFTTDCAITVELFAETGGEQRVHINPSGNVPAQRVKYFHPGGGMGVLTFASAANSLPVNPPMTIALIAHNGTLYAAYKAGATPTAWVLVPGGGVTESAEYGNAGIQLSEENGANGNSGTFRDYDITSVSLADVGL